MRVFRGHTSGVFSVAFSPDGKMAATGGGGGDKSICLWDLAAGKLFSRLTAPSSSVVGSLTFSPDGKVLVSSASDYSIRFWDVEANASAEEGYVVRRACLLIHDRNEKKSALLHTFYTKRTIIHKVAYARSGLVHTVGAYSPS